MYSDEIITSNGCQAIANDIMFGLMQQDVEFTADEFYKAARFHGMPPDLIKKYAGSYFKIFQAAGYIQKTDRYRLSERNGSTPLPVWVKVQ